MRSGKAVNKIILFLLSLLIIASSGVFAYAEDQCPAGGEHDYTVTIIRRATENNDGLRRYVCSRCGKEYTEAIPATGHKWSYWSIETPASCTTDGRAVRKCTRHKDYVHYQYRAVPATGHDFGEWIVDREATGTKDGLEHRVCINDSDHVQYRIIPVIAQATPTVDNSSITKDDSSKASQDTDADKNSHKVTGNTGSRSVPFGAADAAILGANGVALIYFIVLLLPLIRVMFWIAAKRRKAEDDEE
jgi:transposase-like protein